MLLACSRNGGVDVDSSSGAGSDAGSFDGSEHRSIQLTLWPFFELPEGANGFGSPEALDGVTVCVALERAYRGRWEDFRTPDPPLPCATTEPGQKVVLQAPALSEIVVTADKPGYRGSVYAVTTWQWDQDTTGNPFVSADGGYIMHLQRSDKTWARIDPSVTPASDLGDLSFFATTIGWTGAGFNPGMVGGIHVSVAQSERADADRGDGPFFWHGGKFVPSATATLPGELTSLATYSGASFVNLAEGEYVLTTTPASYCTAYSLGLDTIAGFAGDPANTIRAPILGGRSTAIIAASCSCDTLADGRTCVPEDGGAP